MDTLQIILNSTHAWIPVSNYIMSTSVSDVIMKIDKDSFEIVCISTIESTAISTIFTIYKESTLVYNVSLKNDERIVAKLGVLDNQYNRINNVKMNTKCLIELETINDDEYLTFRKYGETSKKMLLLVERVDPTLSYNVINNFNSKNLEYIYSISAIDFIDVFSHRQNVMQVFTLNKYIMNDDTVLTILEMSENIDNDDELSIMNNIPLSFNKSFSPQPNEYKEKMELNRVVFTKNQIPINQIKNATKEHTIRLYRYDDVLVFMFLLSDSIYTTFFIESVTN